MANTRTILSFTVDDLDDTFDFLNQFEDDGLIQDVLVESMTAMMGVAEEGVRSQWVYSGGSSNGLIYNSVGSVVARSTDGRGVVASVGVYSVDSVMVQQGLDPQKDISAGQLAYWLEYGTNRLKSGQAAMRKLKPYYKESDWTVGNSARMFVSKGVALTADDQNEAFMRVVDSKLGI